MVKKMMILAAAGAGAVYLLDSNKGPDRRRRALQLWAENKEQILGAAGWATGTASTLGSMAGEKTNSTHRVIDAGASRDSNTATGDINEHVVAG